LKLSKRKQARKHEEEKEMKTKRGERKRRKMGETKDKEKITSESFSSSVTRAASVAFSSSLN
jgi:hypothetical protein